jgi:hypothetical protein
VLKDQALRLHELGNELLTKASASSKATDVQAFTELALKSYQESRLIWDTIQANSVLTFLECQLRHFDGVTYQNYLDFCARNGLERLSEVDFDAVLGEIRR